MFWNSFWFQLVWLLISSSSGIFYVLKGIKQGVEKALMFGIFLLSVGWSKAALLLERLNISSPVNTGLHLSKGIVPLIGVGIAAMLIKRWRFYILGFGVLLAIFMGVAYKYAPDKAPLISKAIERVVK